MPKIPEWRGLRSKGLHSYFVNLVQIKATPRNLIGNSFQLNPTNERTRWMIERTTIRYLILYLVLGQYVQPVTLLVQITDSLQIWCHKHTIILHRKHLSGIKMGGKKIKLLSFCNGSNITCSLILI